MAIKTKKFQDKKKKEIRAVRVTKNNVLQVANWVGEKAQAVITIDKEGHESKHRVKVRTPRGIRVAQIGDWVYKEVLVKLGPLRVDHSKAFVLTDEKLIEDFKAVK